MIVFGRSNSCGRGAGAFRLRSYAARDEQRKTVPVYPSEAIEEQQPSTIEILFGEKDDGVPLLSSMVVSCCCALLDVNNPQIERSRVCTRERSVLPIGISSQIENGAIDQPHKY